VVLAEEAVGPGTHRFCILVRTQRLPEWPYVEKLAIHVVPKRGIEHQKAVFLLSEREARVAGLKNFAPLECCWGPAVLGYDWSNRKSVTLFADRVHEIGSGMRTGPLAPMSTSLLLSIIPLRGSKIVRRGESTAGGDAKDGFTPRCDAIRSTIARGDVDIARGVGSQAFSTLPD